MPDRFSSWTPERLGRFRQPLLRWILEGPTLISGRRQIGTTVPLVLDGPMTGRAFRSDVELHLPLFQLRATSERSPILAATPSS